MNLEARGFKGAARRLDDVDLPRLGHLIGVGEDVVHAILDVEAAGAGFDDQGRPKMLYEPHLFWRELGPGEARVLAQAQGLAYPSWRRSYPKDSYPRFAEARKIDARAAFRSCSWGLGQILGSNASLAGFDSPEEMVAAFMEDEEHHLAAMVQFIISAGLDDELRRLDWRGFARGYNGPQYERNGYHTKLAKRYAWWATKPDTPWSPAAVHEPPTDLLADLAEARAEAERLRGIIEDAQAMLELAAP